MVLDIRRAPIGVGLFLGSATAIRTGGSQPQATGTSSSGIVDPNAEPSGYGLPLLSAAFIVGTIVLFGNRKQSRT